MRPGSPRYPAAPAGCRPRNWRVPTRLNAILLIPVLVGLVMGGFQVKGSIDTWHEAQDAEKTALVVRAASEYGQALLNERDLTAEPLLTNKRDDQGRRGRQGRPPTRRRRSSTRPSQAMPKDAGPGATSASSSARKSPSWSTIRKTAYTAGVETPDKTGPNGGPVATEEGYVLVQHSLMEFSNELGLGTGNITSYGRTVYAIQLAKAADLAPALHRSCTCWCGRAQKPVVRSRPVDRLLLVRLPGGHRHRRVRLRRHRGGRDQAPGGHGRTRPPRARRSSPTARAAGRGRGPERSSPRRPRRARCSTAWSPRSPPATAPRSWRERGVTPAAWMAASTAKFDGYTIIEKDLVDKAVEDAAQISDERQERRDHQRRHRGDRPAGRLHPGRA